MLHSISESVIPSPHFKIIPPFAISPEETRKILCLQYEDGNLRVNEIEIHFFKIIVSKFLEELQGYSVGLTHII